MASQPPGEGWGPPPHHGPPPQDDGPPTQPWGTPPPPPPPGGPRPWYRRWWFIMAALVGLLVLVRRRRPRSWPRRPVRLPSRRPPPCRRPPAHRRRPGRPPPPHPPPRHQRPTHRPPSRPPPSRRPATAIPPTRTHACMTGSGTTTARVGPGTAPTTSRVPSRCCHQTRSAWTATTTGSAANADADPQAGRGAPSLEWWEGAWMRSAGWLSYEYRDLRERVYAPTGVGDRHRVLHMGGSEAWPPVRPSPDSHHRPGKSSRH